MKYRYLYVLSILFMLLLISCSKGTAGKSAESSDSSPAGGLDFVHLTVQMVGNAPQDLGLIEDKLNEMARKELNCTVSFEYTSWSDYMQRYELLLSSGQNIDLIFTSDWLYYSQFAQKGAFLPLDYLLPLYAPDLMNFVPDDYWDAVKVNGRIYTIPSTWREYVNGGIVYREDLRKRFNLPVPDSLEHMEQYFSGIRKEMPDQQITSSMVVDSGYGPSFSAFSVLEMKYPFVDLNMPYGLAAYHDDPGKLFYYWDTEDFVKDMKMFHRWAQMGFWSKSALSNKNPINDTFINENTIAMLSGQNAVKYNAVTSLLQSKNPHIEVGFYPYSRTSGLVSPVHPIHNGMAIPIHAGHPERALMFYQKLVLDPKWNRLTNYGIEGVHYEVDKDGYYRMLGDANSNGFPREAMNSWAWRNPEYMLFDRNYSKVLDLFKEFDKYATPDIFSGFTEDYSSYQAERSALYQIESEYLLPIEAGLVDDVDAAIADFRARAKAAGIDKIHKEYREQWQKYIQQLHQK